jgi:hypothetical protein
VRCSRQAVPAHVRHEGVLHPAGTWSAIAAKPRRRESAAAVTVAHCLPGEWHEETEGPFLGAADESADGARPLACAGHRSAVE